MPAYASDDVEWAVQAEKSDRLLLKNPKDNEIWSELVTARLNLKDLQRADEALKIWRHNVPSAPTKFPLIDRLQGDLDYSRHDLSDAIKSWTTYLKHAPEDVEGWDRLAWAQERLGNRKGGIESISHAIQTKPDADHYAWRARLRVRLRDWTGAEADVLAGNKLDATNRQIQQLFPIFERKSEWMPELDVLNKAVKDNPNGEKGASALVDRALWLGGQGWAELAYEDAASGLEKNPKSLRAQFWKGVFAWDLNEPSKAGWVRRPGNTLRTQISSQRVQIIAVWDREIEAVVKEIDPDVRAWKLLGMGQPVMAWQEVKEIDGSIAKVDVLLELGQLVKAEDAARRAVALHPDDPLAWKARALRELGNGNVKETLEDLDRADALKTPSVVGDIREEALRTLGTK